jgi:hypothetical protein
MIVFFLLVFIRKIYKEKVLKDGRIEQKDKLDFYIFIYRIFLKKQYQNMHHLLKQNSFYKKN